MPFENCWVIYFHQSVGPSKWKQLPAGNQLTSVEQRSIWTLWCSYGPNCSHALHTTTSMFISSTLLLKAKNYCTHNGTSWLTSWLSWAQEHLHIAMSIWSWLLSFITTNYIMQEITLNSIKVYHAGSNFEFHQSGNHVILVEQRSIWTLWCCVHTVLTALMHYTQLPHWFIRNVINFGAPSEELPHVWYYLAHVFRCSESKGAHVHCDVHMVLPALM